MQGRIVAYRGEWLVFVDDARVPPTNNLAEQALRPLVVLRKITFGHRALEGGEQMADLMTAAETVRRHGHRVSQIFRALMTHPPNKVLRRLYAKAVRRSALTLPGMTAIEHLHDNPPLQVIELATRLVRKHQPRRLNSYGLGWCSRAIASKASTL